MIIAGFLEELPLFTQVSRLDQPASTEHTFWPRDLPKQDSVSTANSQSRKWAIAHRIMKVFKEHSMKKS